MANDQGGAQRVGVVKAPMLGKPLHVASGTILSGCDIICKDPPLGSDAAGRRADRCNRCRDARQGHGFHVRGGSCRSDDSLRHNRIPAIAAGDAQRENERQLFACGHEPLPGVVSGRRNVSPSERGRDPAPRVSTFPALSRSGLRQTTKCDIPTGGGGLLTRFTLKCRYTD